MIINRFLMVCIMVCGLVTHSAFAHVDLVVIVNTHSNINSLTKAELRRIFLGQTGNYPNGQSAIPLDVIGDFRDSFYQNILTKTPESVENYWASMIFTGKAQPPRQVQPNEAKEIVATSPRAISYIDRAKVDASVKVITIVNDK
jgi:ABC-type phosphate transport system substrate-binding protein